MSPFDEARYARLLEGLEVSEIQLSKVVGGTPTHRFDPEYFQKQHIADEAVIARRIDDFCSFSDIGLTVDASAFYPSIERYYGEGTLPFLRVADVDSIIDFEGCIRIPEHLCTLYPTLAKVKPGDILLTKGGSVARVGLVTQSAAASRDLIFLNSSRLPREEQIFIYLYAQSDFFNRALLRSSSQTAQPHLTITLVRNLQVLRASEGLKMQLLELVDEAFEARVQAIAIHESTEKKLMNALGLDDWKAPDPLTYVRSSHDSFAAGRLDAEHFKPKYGELLEHLAKTSEATRLGSLLAKNDRGNQPEYADKGLPVINSKHVFGGEVRLDADNRTAIADAAKILIEPGDVLMNGTGVGTIGRSAPYLHSGMAIPDNHVTVLRPKPNAIDPLYLSVFLNSLAGQMQVEQRLHGSSGQIELYPSDIAEFVVWVAPEKIQKEIRQAVENEFASKQRATHLLNIAKRAVDIAIEQDEKSAFAYLESQA